VVEEARSEANVPTEQAPSVEAARLPASDVDPRRPPGAAEPPAEGSTPPVGVIWRVRDRHAFDALRSRGRRVRRGPVTVTFVPETPLKEPGSKEQAEPPKVAFAVGRRVGRAVRRNRLRRQLRSIMRELVAEPESPVGPGTYLVGASPEATALSYQELKNTVHEALAQVQADRQPAPEGRS
jgi:ribonuclease P protein component